MGEFVRRDEEDLSDLDYESNKSDIAGSLPVRESVRVQKLSKQQAAKPKKSGCGVVLFFLFIIVLIVAAFGYMIYTKRLQVEIPLLKNIDQIPLLKSTLTTKVNLAITPPDAEILLDNALIENVSAVSDKQTFLATAAGIHTLTIRKVGFRDYVKEIEIPKSGEISLEPIILSPKTPGLVTFKNYLINARIFLNGEKLDVSPNDIGLYSLELKPGKYSIRIEKPGFKTWSKDFEVPSDDGVELGVAKLTELGWRPLEIDVNHIDVEVLVNDRPVETHLEGQTLVTEPIEPGIIKLEIRAQGYISWVKDNVEVFSDLTNSVGPIELVPIAPFESPKKEMKKEAKKVTTTVQNK